MLTQNWHRSLAQPANPLFITLLSLFLPVCDSETVKKKVAIGNVKYENQNIIFI
jgi:hypothetical protein